MSKSKSEAQFRLIPVSDLVLSPLNVRQTGCEAGIEQLSTLILAEGVLQNLNVHVLKDIDTAAYSYGVIAGGRRLRALQLLVKQKHIKADYLVPCMIVSIERALQISLTENSGREPMIGYVENLSSISRDFYWISLRESRCFRSVLSTINA